MSSKPDLSAVGLIKSTEGLAKLDHKKYSAIPSDDVIAATVKGLTAKGHKATVVDDAAGALKAIQAIEDLKESSIFLAGSTTLEEIGLTTFLKDNEKAVKRNIKAELLAAQAKGDFATAGKLIREGLSADYFVSSVVSITKDGNLFVVDVSGSRTGGFIASSRNVIVVAGAHKIVDDDKAATARLDEYVFPLENARVKIAYGPTVNTAVNNSVVIRGVNPWGGQNRIHVILIKQAVGF